MSDKLLQQLIDFIVIGKIDEAAGLAQKALDEKIAPMDIVGKALIPSMTIVSEKYDKKEYFLPQMLISSDAFYAAFDLLKDKISGSSAKGKGKIVCGVVEGDVHDIGKNLVKTVLEANGFICIDMGRDVPVEDLLDKVEEENADFLLLSTLMTPTMLSMKRTVEGLEEDGIRDGVKVMLGGGPLNWDFAKKIGADFYGADEKEALAWANEQVGS